MLHWSPSNRLLTPLFTNTASEGIFFFQLAAMPTATVPSLTSSSSLSVYFHFLHFAFLGLSALLCLLLSLLSFPLPFPGGVIVPNFSHSFSQSGCLVFFFCFSSPIQWLPPRSSLDVKVRTSQIWVFYSRIQLLPKGSGLKSTMLPSCLKSLVITFLLYNLLPSVTATKFLSPHTCYVHSFFLFLFL